MRGKKRLFILFLLLGCGIFATLWMNDIYEDRQHRISIEAPTSLYEAPDLAAYQQLGGKSILQFMPGDQVAVKRIKHGKDYLAIRIETAAGSTGWVVLGPNIKLISPKS